VSAFNRAAQEAVRSAIERARDAVQLMQPDSRWIELCGRVDLARAVRSLAEEERPGGALRECSDELRRKKPLGQNEFANGCRIPYESLAMLTRADIAASSSQGGYLVSTMNLSSAAQSLLSMLVLGALGVTAIDATSNVNLPKVTSSTTGYWLSAESTQITEADPTFGQTSFSAHHVGAYSQLSRLLTLQGLPDAGVIIATELVRKLRRTIEAAALSGAGTGGAPHGVIGTSGVGAVSGATLALSGVMSAVTDTGDALEPGSNAGWATARSVASTLRQRQELTNSSFTLWQGRLEAGTLGSYPSFSTSNIGSGIAIFGNWIYACLVDFAGGLEIGVDPYGMPGSGQFQNAIVGLRSLAALDFGLVWPSAFTVVSSIT